jgi:hypothetical protein
LAVIQREIQMVRKMEVTKTEMAREMKMVTEMRWGGRWRWEGEGDRERGR